MTMEQRFADMAARHAARRAEREARRLYRAAHPPRPTCGLGVVVNPKTLQPAFPALYGRDGEPDPFDFVEVSTSSSRSTWIALGSFDGEAWFGYPVVHTGGDSGEGVKVKGQGLGTVLYASMSLAVAMMARGQAPLPKKIQRVLQRETLAEGICSEKGNRTSDAQAWWTRAASMGLVDDQDNFAIFPFESAQRYCAVIGVTSWFGLDFEGRTDTALQEDVFSTLSLVNCDDAVVQYLQAIAHAHRADKTFDKLLQVAHIEEREQLRANPSMPGLPSSEKRLLRERQATIEALGLVDPGDV